MENMRIKWCVNKEYRYPLIVYIYHYYDYISYDNSERFRWCKYVKGQHFEKHVDARFTRSDNEKSFYTVNVYLNDGTKDFSGGRTRFFNFSSDGVNDGFEMTVGVTATTGLSLMFNQHPDRLWHDGEQLHDGVKYLMRTDVMYKCDKKHLS